MKTHTPPKFLNRFTTIPFLMDLLKHGQLTLINPKLWKDRNDWLTMDLYRRKKGKPSIYALCFTHFDKTSQHWSAFAGGTKGCCIEFDYEKLMDDIAKKRTVIRGKTEYIKIDELNGLEDDIEKLPFWKRWPYSPEKEFRIVALGDKPQEKFLHIPISLDSIKTITITGRLSESKFENTKKIITGIFKGKVFHSTLLDNPRWRKHFKEHFED